ncbi:MAG: sulfate permease [Sandaracinaceae bacterium]|jgi:SulP family sulfate permease|nr:sulfate permease [Sandaracinaceae bacterium]MBK7151013.1 sulfate permease [Sandaracinaceae bacterium]MBK7773136.1 sulfate permease [Sandaracinaceae bacterium]
MTAAAQTPAKRRSLRPAWLRGYDRAVLRADVIAGVIVAAVLIPQAMAYATLANLPPIVGLYAAAAAPLFYPLLASSRRLAVGPVALDSMLVAGTLATLGAVAVADRVAYGVLLALMVGAILFVLGVLRFGFVANFLSRPVVLGFTAGAALLIASGQVGPLMGISLPTGQGLHAVVWAAVKGASGAHVPTLVVGVVSVALLLALRKPLPRASSPIVLGGALVVSALLHLEDHGVRVVGELPRGLPMPAVPGFDFLASAPYEILVPAALTIALVAFTEAIATARAIAEPGSVVRPSQELAALGVSNLAAGLFGGYPVTGGLSRSAINAGAGARTPLAGAVTALLVALALMVATGALYALPMASLAALVIVAVLKLIDVAAAKRIARTKRGDAVVLGLTFVATALLGAQTGLLIGVALSVGAFLISTSKPHFAVLGRLPGTEDYLNVERHPHAVQEPGVVVLRIDAQLYFGNVTFLQDCVRGIVSEQGVAMHTLVIEAAGVNQLDSAAAETLDALDRELEGRGVRLLLTHVKGPVRDVLARTDMLLRMARTGRIYLGTHEAVMKAASGEELIGRDPEKDPDPRALADRVGCGETARRLIPREGRHGEGSGI